MDVGHVCIATVLLLLSYAVRVRYINSSINSNPIFSTLREGGDAICEGAVGSDLLLKYKFSS